MKIAKSKTRKPVKTPKYPVRSQAFEELEYGEQLYRSIAESMPDGTVTVDAQGKIVLWNRAAEKIFGYTTEEMLGKPLTRIMPKRFHETHKNSLNRAASGGKPRIIGKTVEVIGLREDKSEFPLELSMSKWKTSEGVFFTAMIRDIGERRLAEDALRERLKELTCLYRIGLEVQKDLHVNDLCRRVIEHLVMAMQFPEVAAAVIELDGKRLESKKYTDGLWQDLQAEIRVGGDVRGHLSVHYVEKRPFIVPYEQNLINSIARTLGLWLERKQAEEALQHSEAKLKEAQIAGQMGSWEFDVETQKITWSDNTYKLYDRHPALGPPTAEEEASYYSQEQAVKLREYARCAIEEGKDFKYDLEADLPSGRHVFYSATMKPIMDARGRVAKLFGTVQDITEQKKMLDSLTITDRLSALGSMAGGLAHELNNPLTGVIGYAQLLLDRKDLSADVRRDLTGIYEEAQRASEVIRNFMVFALKRPQQKQLSDINSLINDVLKLRQNEQKKNNIKVITNFDPELPLVMVGPVRMRQVFLDIITNAEYFIFESHKKGTLTITTETKGDVIKASFADNGPGIPPENLGQIFNPFFTTKEIGQGVGLGLSICHRIVTEHGGNIQVESEPGKGATFIVELPLTKE